MKPLCFSLILLLLLLLNMPEVQSVKRPTPRPTGQPSGQPSRQPTGQPSRQPTRQPSGQPTRQPTGQPSTIPTSKPSSSPSQFTATPTSLPSSQPSRQPSRQPTGQPSRQPTGQPTGQPTRQPTGKPSTQPTGVPTGQPSRQPTGQPTILPSSYPSSQPSSQPSSFPTQPTGQPTSAPSNPTGNPTSQPTRQPTQTPSAQPSRQPTRQPTGQPTRTPTSQPTRQPTGQPTSQPSTPTGQPTSMPTCPTGQPTGQPTGRPTRQPTRQPTSQPSTRPTGQPSTSPSNKPIVNRIVIDIEFESDIDIKKGTTVSLYLPQIEQSNLITTEPSIVENYIAMPILWTLTWYGMNQTLHLVAKKDIPASVQKFSIESELLVLSDTVIYEDSNDITYSIYSPTDSVVPGGYIDTVSATGFETASLSFSNRRCNESTDIIVGFTSDQTFVYGDKIMIHIPNLINTNDYGRKTGLSIEAAGMTNVSAYMYVIWNDVDSTFVLNILHTFKSIDSLIIKAENGFKIPVDGINNKTGSPMIQLRSNWELFGPALFEYFQPISCLTNATIAYKPASSDLSVQAGQDVIVSLYFEYTTHGFYEYDIVDVFLPLTWSKSISQLTITDPNFKATWIQCEETLRVQCTNTTEFVSSFDMDIYGLRLPDQGVNASLAGYFRVSTNSSSGSFDTTPLTSVDLISHVIESSIKFEEAILSGTTSMTVSVTLATQLEQDDVIRIYLPAVSMISNDAAITSSHNVSFQWDSATDTLEVTVDAVISPADAVYIYCDVSLPSTGFPPVNSALARVPPTISLTGVNGMIDSVSFKSVETVGLRYGAVHYGLFNELSDEVSLRLQFFLSGTIAQDDVIKIFTPYVYKSSSTAIVASGDQAEDEFASPFNITTHLDPSVLPGDRYIQLQATDALIAAREINVFIDHGNDLFLDRTSLYENQTNYITAELSSFGELINSTLDYFPKEMNRVAVVNGVNTSLCPVAFSVEDEFTRNDCSIDVDLNLSRDLVAGESIIISHEGLIHSRGSTQLSIASDASAYFDAYWRDADEVDDLSLSSTEIGRIEEGYVYTHSTYSYFDPNSTIPFEKTSLGATIISDIPRILAVYVPDSVTDLTCKDAVFIHLQFTERVMVTSSQAKMLLNTLEYARYYDGNGTDLLRFVYNVDAPVTTVDLSIFGPSALELGLTSISRAGRADVVANVTIPRPHNTLLRNKYSFEAIAVSCEQELLVSKVYSLRDGNKTYYSGDIIDVAVEFIRDVAVIGSPSLTLSNSSDVRAMYKGTYSTVSTTQVITIQSSNVTSAYFQVSYNGISSKCVSSSDSTALYDELVSMATLELSLPVELSLTAIPNGYQHTLNFTGITPGLLTVSGTACGNQPAAVTSVSTDDSTLNTLVFRYIVGEEDVADKLLVTALLQDSDNYVYIRGQTPSFSNLSIVLPSDENSFEDTTSIALKRIKPSVEYLTSPSAGLTMISGDYIDISVVFTAPIIVFGYPVLALKFDSFLPQQDSGNYVKQVPMYDTSEDSIRFRYNVQVGDEATTLEVNSTLSLHLNGSEIKLNSLYPTVDADVTLPVSTTGSLSTLNIKVEAITEPVVNSVYPDKVKGLYSAGELIYINIQYSSPVQLVASSSSTPPHIVFGNNSAGQSFKMYYVSGTNTSVVTFLYTVEYGDDTDELVLNQDSNGYFIHVENGEFRDYIGNIWNKSYVSSADFESLSLIGISTAAAGVERVDVVQADGTYYPGQSLDIYVRFSKNVLIFPNPLNGNLPSLALFVPFQDEDQLLAVYSHGNGTAELHFEYVIPVPNTDYNIHPEVQLNYEGVAALASHMRGGLIRDAAVNAVTDANVALPAVDKSYLLYSRDVKLVFARPKVASIHFLPSTPDGTYGVGDQVQLAITFTQPVMVFEPPVLKLFTAFGSATATNRSATYVSGNYSHVLYYMYEVQDGDRSSDEGVDYIDTRYSPYFLSNSPVSLALNSDVIRSNTGRVNTDGGFNREDDIVLTPTKKGGIFRATRTSSLVLANTELPLPGDPGSLSANHRVVIDTRSPNITGVYTPLHNGSYGAGVVIPVLVSFNYPVVVRGCPRLLFRVSNTDKYAEYASGSTTDKLLFEYTVEEGDYLDKFDYFHTSSLSVIPCTFEDEEISARTDESTYYIRRMSRIPTADVNFTLPFVTYVETVIAPVSLTGRGSYLTLVGSRARPLRVVTTSDTRGRTYGIGDVVMVGIEYSDRGIQVANGVYLLLQNVSHGSYFSHIDKKNSNLAWFSLVILQYDRTAASLAYRDSFALYSNEICDIRDRFGDCAAYNLPVPGGTGDELSLQNIILTDTTGIISGITMIASEVGFALEETASILGVPLTTLSQYRSQDRTRGFGRCEGLGRRYSLTHLTFYSPTHSLTHVRSHYYHEIADEKSLKRKFLTTSCPNHFCVDQTASIEENFSKGKIREIAVEIPLIPAFAQIPTNISLLSTDIGIALNGVPFGGPVWSSPAEYRQAIDKCGGFADDNGNYRYVVPPVCLLTQLNRGGVEHSPQIGWALDGFPIYGPRGVDGLDMVPCAGSTNTSCLDECNGYYGELPAIDNFKYRYYVSSQVGDGNCSSYIENGVEYGVSGECRRGTDSCCVSQIPASSPFILGCLKGCLLSDATCVSTEVGIVDELAVNTVPRHPTRRYDGSVESTQDFIDEDIKIPRDSYYPDPVFDLVSNVTNRGQIPYETGSLIEFVVTFTEPVLVQGTPSLVLYFSEGLEEINTQDDVLQPKNLLFSHMKSPNAAVFNGVVNAAFAATNGYILCSRYSKISLNGGRVLKQANFLPVRAVDLSLGPLCCAENCKYVAPVLTSTDVTPRVSKVYSNQAGSLANPDEIDIFVEFNTPVAVIGSPFLELDLAGTPRATYLLRPSMNTLQFRYTISSQDFSSSLDYSTTYSLGISTGFYDNVVKAGIYEYIPADLTLPERGSTASLGRTSSIVIDNSRAQVLAVDSSVGSVTAGDDIKITVSYNQMMAVPDSRYSRVELLFVINDGNVTVPRQAYLLTQEPAYVLEFLYTVTALDPTGVVFLGDEYPLEYTTREPLKEESYIRTAANNVKGPVKFLRQFLVKSLCSIDTQVPAVLGIASPDTGTQYPWGVGDVINIYVTLTLPVVIVTEPTLLLAFEDSTPTATYVATSSTNASLNYTSVLHFKYVISDGDVALPLEYASSYSLLGDIRRYSANPLLQANLELPVPYSPGSLSSQSSVKVDTSPPYVESLFPAKRAGIYGANEVIVVVARFNKPVLVVGNPYLVLQTGVNTRGFANYTEFNASVLYSSIDVPIAIDILSTDVLFTYVVKKEDNTVNIHQEGVDSLVLGPGDQILHLTTIPTTAADVELRDPTDYELVNGQLVKQWKFRYPRKIELILRNLYHTDVSTLKVELEHLGKKAVVFDNVLHDRGKAFELGRSYPRSRLGNNETWIDIDTGIGHTYLFSDTQLVNIALLGAPQQSSTLQPAKYATDGNTDPLVSHFSVTETDNEVDAWWQVLLPVDSQVATINVYPRKPQSFVFPIIRVLMKGYDDYPKGRFCLHIVGFDVNNPTSARTTSYLQFGSTAAQVKAKISALEGIGEVDVTMSMLQLCGVDHPGGCGSDGMEGYGYMYHIEFLSVQVSSPTVTVENVTWVGGTVKNGGINETENTVVNQLYVDVTTTRAGFWHEVSNIEEYGMGVTVNGTAATTESSTTAGDNQWLTPFWVMIFDLTEPPPSDLEESLKLAIFKQYYTSATDVCETALPAAVNATYVRVQRYGYGSLSLAEVEVYEEKLNTFSAYRSTSPVAEAPVTRPYQSAMPFMHEFNQLSVDGRWTVHLTQSGQLAHGNNHFGYGGAYGTISDAVLVITDIVGITHSYYQDLSAQVTSLPKYGKLYKSRSYSTHSYGDWRELFDITENGELVVREGGSRYMGYCYGVDTSGMNGVRSGVDGYRHCTDNFGVPPEFADYTLGDHASENYLRNERVVIYKPNLRYLGPDGFTYKVFDGVNEQVHSVKNGIAGYLNEVTVHVRTCRVYDYKVSKGIATTLEPICDCEESEYSIFNDEEKCNEARTDICSDVSKREHYYAMCVACTEGFDTSECIAQTTRALGFMSAKGLCSTAPRIDCSDETVTAPGRDRINYMSLKAPISSYHTFTALGNSFGFSQM